MHSKLFKYLITLILIFFLFGCDENPTGSSKTSSNGILISSLTGNWILVKEKETETFLSESYTDSSVYTLTTSPEIFSISRNLVMIYDLWEPTQTTVTSLPISSTQTIEDIFAVMAEDTDIKVSKTSNKLYVTITYTEGSFTEVESYEYDLYSGAVPPAHWPTDIIIDTVIIDSSIIDTGVTDTTISDTTSTDSYIGSWILTKDIETYIEGTITESDTVIYTTSTSDLIMEITSSCLTNYYNDIDETSIDIFNIPEGQSLEQAIQNSTMDPEASVDISVVNGKLIFEASMTEMNETYIIRMEFSKYTGPLPPTHWPPIPTVDIPTNATTLTSSSIISGNLSTEGEVIWYKVNATSGTTYTMTTSGYLDSHLRLYEVNGSELKLISANDDYNDDFNSQIIWKCTTSGAYYLSLRGFEDYETGNFGLTLSTSRSDLTATNFIKKIATRKKSKTKRK